MRKKCRLDCNADETAYHVVSSCLIPEYTIRHDTIVYNIIKSILQGTVAPDEIKSQLKYGKASLVAEYNWGERQDKIRAGVTTMTDPELYHNRPDIIIILTNPSVVYVMEIAVAHLQNFHLQEKIKNTRYAKNSSIHITKDNYNNVSRDYNLLEALERMHKCPVKLAVLVFGALGEIVETSDHKNALKILGYLGINAGRMKGLISQCSFNAATSSAKIIMRRINHSGEV